MAKKGIILFGAIIIVVLALVVYAGNDNNKISATVYKSPTCGCCVKYIPYANGNGFDIETITTSNMDLIKQTHGIPSNMESCHTMIVENYFVEGHIPTEAIDKLLLEQPDIDGIALPGMPSGSPGMPGTKQGDFIIYAIKGGQISEFMRI